jgi:hypothetical protein
MSNQIQPLDGNDLIAADQPYFTEVVFSSVPFAAPSVDTIRTAAIQDDQTVVVILDVVSDVQFQDKYTIKCVNKNYDLTAAESNQYLMNILLYMSENIVRIFGIQITRTYFTNDSNFPDASSQIYNPNMTLSNVNGDPTNSDLTQQLKDIGNKVKAALPNSNTIIIILIIVAIGIVGVGYIVKKA